MSIKIAYICLCHMDPAIVARTAKTLRYGSDGFFIHVDGKQDDAPFRDACAGLENVHFVEDRIKVFWGGFHSILATMQTIKLALATDRYDRFILLQGQDYPLVSPEEIHSFFQTHADTEFCRGKNISASADKRDYMKCCGFWLMDTRPGFPLNYARALLHRINTLGIRYRSATFRCGNEAWSIYHGSALFALTRECVQYILDIYDHNEAYNQYMKYRFPPDELYFHTILYNSPFRDKVSETVTLTRSGRDRLINVTYFEYPKIITVYTEKEDYPWLRNTGCLFARKLNSSSAALLDEIDRHILA